MNLEFPLNEAYQAYSSIEIHKIKDKNVFHKNYLRNMF